MNIRVNGPTVNEFGQSELLFRCVCRFLKKNKERNFVGMNLDGTLAHIDHFQTQSLLDFLYKEL